MGRVTVALKTPVVVCRGVLVTVHKPGKSVGDCPLSHFAKLTLTTLTAHSMRRLEAG